MNTKEGRVLCPPDKGTGVSLNWTRQLSSLLDWKCGKDRSTKGW